MMKAEVTAENRPAWGLSQHVRTRAVCITYEYQCRVQIRLVIVLYEPHVILFGLPEVMLVELVAEILLSQLPVLFLSVR